jgi:hypothetical protein
MTRRRRLWAIVLGILALFAVLLVWAAWPGSSTFTVSPETTYVTEPLDKHGYVDYVTALNDRLCKGITPENNANVLIWQALGPHPEGGTMPPKYFQWLGIESPPEEGEYLVSWRDYVKQHVKTRDSKEREAYDDRMTGATKRPYTPKEQPELADWLKQNEKPLALVTQATWLTDYYNPLVPRSTEGWSSGLLSAVLANVQQCRELAAALACRAMLRVSEGKVDEAWQDLLACHRLGRLIARGGTAIEMSVGLAIDNIAARADVAFLDYAKLTSQQAMACLEDLRQLPTMSGLADKIDLGERFVLLSTIMLTARHGTPFVESLLDPMSRPAKGDQIRDKLFTRSFNWDPAFRNANRWIDRSVAGLHLTGRDAREHEMTAINRDLGRLQGLLANTGIVEGSFMGSESRGEMIGNIIIVVTLPGFHKIQSAAESCEQRQRNLHVAFALAAYQRDHDRYPAKLDELAPKNLDTIPDDLFSGKPLIYRPDEKGYLLYSVGVNGVDEDGRGPDDEPRGDDISIRIPVPEPQKPAEPGADLRRGP